MNLAPLDLLEIYKVGAWPFFIERTLLYALIVTAVRFSSLVQQRFAQVRDLFASTQVILGSECLLRVALLVDPSHS